MTSMFEIEINSGLISLREAVSGNALMLAGARVINDQLLLKLGGEDDVIQCPSDVPSPIHGAVPGENAHGCVIFCTKDLLPKEQETPEEETIEQHTFDLNEILEKPKPKKKLWRQALLPTRPALSCREDTTLEALSQKPGSWEQCIIVSGAQLDVSNLCLKGEPNSRDEFTLFVKALGPCGSILLRASHMQAMPRSRSDDDEVDKYDLWRRVERIEPRGFEKFAIFVKAETSVFAYDENGERIPELDANGVQKMVKGALRKDGTRCMSKRWKRDDIKSPWRPGMYKLGNYSDARGFEVKGYR